MNSISDGLRKLGHQVDILSIFGVSKYRQTNPKLVKITDSVMFNRNWRTLLIYILSKIILFFVLCYHYLKRGYDIIYAVDSAAANVGQAIKIIHKVSIVHNVQSSLVKDLINQKKITKNSLAYHYFIKEEKKSYQNVNLLIANSSYTKNHIQSTAPDHAPIEISRNLVDEGLFYPNSKIKEKIKKHFNIPKNKFIILCPARLVKRKGVVFPLLALTELSAENNDYYLVYAGDGPEKKTLLKLINKNHLNNRVKILGNVPYKKMGQIYNIADVAVIPSVTYAGLEEPLGITALESMASGVPTIASEIGGLKETIRNEYNGILVPEKNKTSLAQAIKSIRKNPEKKKYLIDNGLKEIKEKYTKIKVAQNLIKMFSGHINNLNEVKK
jgi:glycosyltransferase involved in cell wall biosynthesis